MFGKILKGMDIVKKIGTTKTNAQDRPEQEVIVSDSGVLSVDEPFAVAKEDAV